MNDLALKILNYSDHPTRIGFTVFRFLEKERADYFEELLVKDVVYYESSFDEENKLFLYGVRKGDAKKTMNANYLVSAKFRKKIIPNVYFRWGVIFFVTVVIVLAIAGSLIKT